MINYFQFQTIVFRNEKIENVISGYELTADYQTHHAILTEKVFYS